MATIQPIQIGKKLIGPGNPAYVIFEVASTHANDWNLAKDYVKQAKEVGADAVKFQLFTSDNLLNPISTYLDETYQYFTKSETPRDWFPRLVKLCQDQKIDLLCTPFDVGSAIFLNKIGLIAMKVSSGDLTNHLLLSHIAKLGKPVLLSTGMGTMSEVEAAVKTLQDNGCQELALLQCTSVYPMPYEDTNLKAMITMQNKFNTVVGYSDNGSKGSLVPEIAIAMGASIIEKHVTSKKERGSMDDVFSLSLEEFKQMVSNIRKIEELCKNSSEIALAQLEHEHGEDVANILGDTEKKPATHGYVRKNGFRFTESDERHWARRGIYLKIDIKKGTKIAPEMLIFLRPDVGVSGTEYYQVIGSQAEEDLKANHPLKLNGPLLRMLRKSDIHPMYDNEDKEFATLLHDTFKFD